MFAANMVPGGPGKDGIPAIDRPRFVVPRPGLLADDDVVCVWLFPLALAILLGGLAWSAKRLAGLGPPSIRAYL